MDNETQTNLDKQSEGESTESTVAPPPPLTASAKLKRNLITVLAFLIPVAGFFHQEVAHRIGVFYYTEQYVMIFVGVALFLLFLVVPARKKDIDRWMIWDVLPSLICLVACCYVAFNWTAIYVQGASRVTPLQLVLGTLVLILSIEACRRTVGWPMVIVVLVFLAYAFFGYKLTGTLRTSHFSLSNIIGYIYLSTQGVFGMPSETVGITVLAFTTFGCFLSASKAGEFFYMLALSIIGTVRGGAAKVVILCSALFSTMTGEPISNCGIVGPMTYPLMKKLDYDKVFCAAVISVASCGSMITPPVMAAVAFLMGQLTGLGFPAVALSAIFPAILYYLAIYFQVDFYVAKQGYKSIPKEEIPRIRDVLKNGWHYLLPIALLVYFLLVIRYTPASAVYYATLSMIVISVIKKEDRAYFKTRALGAFVETGKSMITVMALCAASGIIMALVTVTGFGIKLSSTLTLISGGNLLFLAIISAVCIYIMGMGMPPLVSYIMLAILVAPTMVQMGVHLMAAHFFILYMSISAFITPPVAMASYVTGQMVGADGFKISLKAMRIGIVCYLIPFVSIYTPALLMIGTPFEIITAVPTAVLGVISLSVGLEGYFAQKIGVIERIIFLVGGLMLFIPNIIISLIGLAIILVPSIRQIRMLRKNKIAKNAVT
ncbi:TRAP transporter fused permease subunit [Lachnospiraceae bacterium ZAX-1]